MTLNVYLPLTATHDDTPDFPSMASVHPIIDDSLREKLLICLLLRFESFSNAKLRGSSRASHCTSIHKERLIQLILLHDNN